MPIYEIDDLIPSLADSVYVADAATVIGNATLCEDVSVWSVSYTHLTLPTISDV